MLPPVQEQAALLLATGKQKTSVAKSCKISRETLHQWLKLPEFQAQLKENRRKLFEEGLGDAIANLQIAVECLVNVCSDKNAPPAARISAASKLIDTAGRWTVVDQEERLKAIETQLGLNHAEPGSQNQTSGA